MADYAVCFVQSLCLLGYLYGAWLVITHKGDGGPMRGLDAASPTPRNQVDEDLVWRRYLAYDW